MTSREHPIDNERVRAALDEVVRVMKTIPSVWESREPASTGVEAQLAGRTTVEQYLRWGKVPDTERILAHDGPWPRDSSTALRISGTLSTHRHLAPLREPFEALDELLEANGYPARYAYGRAYEAFERRDDDACVAAAEDALALEADYPNAAHIAGWALLRKKDFARALPLLERAHTIAPDDPNPVIHLCEALVGVSRSDEAVALMTRAADNNLTEVHAHNWLGWYFTRHARDLERAISELEKSLLLRNWGTAWLNYGYALELAGRREDAFIAYASALLAGDSYDAPWAEKQKAALGAALRAEGKTPFDPAEWIGQASSFLFVFAMRTMASTTRQARADEQALAAIDASMDVRWGAAAEPLDRIAERLRERGDIEVSRRIMAAACAAYDATATGLAHEAEGDRARKDAERARKKLARWAVTG